MLKLETTPMSDIVDALATRRSKLPGDRRLTLGLSINGSQTRLTTVVELHRAHKSFADEAFRQIWINGKNGPALCALFNGGVGWLIYAREYADGGFSSRNPN